MSTLTELITEHRITATNPFGSPRESDEAAVQMAKALEAVVEVLDAPDPDDHEHDDVVYLEWANDRLDNARAAITAALTKGTTT